MAVPRETRNREKQEVGASHGHTDEHATVKVAPDGDQGDDQPDAPIGARVLSTEQEQEQREGEPREELRSNDSEGRKHPEARDQQYRGGGDGSRSPFFGAPGQYCQCCQVGDDESEGQCENTKAVDEVEDELAENRNVDPPA